MTFKTVMLLLPALLGSFLPASSYAQRLTAVYRNPDFQLTGITVSKSGRLFVNFPRWSDRYVNAVVEVKPDGTTAPFPDEMWNSWNNKPSTAGQQFVCVQSVVVDQNDALWVLDPAAPMMGPVVEGGVKLVKVDLATNQVSQVILFDPTVALPDSYLNDIRFDNSTNTAYITDSGHGGIVVVDLGTGTARRTLDGDPSVMSEPGVQVVVDGRPVVNAYGKPFTANSDGIALSPDNQYLYYKAVTANSLWRVPTQVLRDSSAAPAQVSAAVEKVATTFPTDGLWIDSQNRIYLTDLNENAVVRLLPDGTMQKLATGDRLQWPDTFTEGPDGSIYVTASHINLSPTYNDGFNRNFLPYAVFKVTTQ